MAFAKLDSGIINSTIWVQPHDVLRTWIWFLSQADANGVVRTAAPALAHACMVSLDRMREILVILESPDMDSRTETDEGRRIRKVSGGWEIINYRAYRNHVQAEEKKEADRARIAEKRAAERAGNSEQVSQPVADVAACRTVSQPVADVAQAEAEEDKDQKQEHVQRAARFAEFWAAYPNKKGRAEAERTWRRKRLDGKADELIGHVRRMLDEDDGWRRGFVPMGSTYLNGDRWEDVPGMAGNPRLAVVGGYQPLPGEV